MCGVYKYSYLCVGKVQIRLRLRLRHVRKSLGLVVGWGYLKMQLYRTILALVSCQLIKCVF